MVSLPTHEEGTAAAGSCKREISFECTRMLERQVQWLIGERLALTPAEALLGPRWCGKTTLARFGNHCALDKLIEILEDDREPDLTRAPACAGLELICAPKPPSSLARGAEDQDYRASTDLVTEFLSIL